MIVPTDGSVPDGGRSKTSSRAPSAYPSKVYYPRNALEVVLAIREVSALRQSLSVRGPGDRDADELRGPVLSVTHLDKILTLDRAARTVTVEPGVPVAKLEAFLAGAGLGLKVCCGELARVVGSFAAMLGAGPSSHRYGLFTDQVVALEQVSRDGSTRRYHRAREGSVGIVRRLTTGGDVTINLTLELVARDKQHALVRHQVQRFAGLSEFVTASGEHMRAEQGALLKFARVVDPAPGRPSRVHGAIVSAYEVGAGLESATRMLARGQAALARRARSLSRASVWSSHHAALSLCETRYATLAEAESQPFRERKTLEGARVYRLIAPEGRYEPLVAGVHRHCAQHAARGAIESIAIDVTSVRSAYLSARDGGEHCELRLAVLLGPGARDGASRATFEAVLGELCHAHGARRVGLPGSRADERAS